jgi:hypothetical protein
VDAEDSQLILGAYVSQSSADNNELEPMVKAVSDNLGQKPQALLADRGYINGPMIEQIHKLLKPAEPKPKAAKASKPPPPTLSELLGRLFGRVYPAFQ